MPSCGPVLSQSDYGFGSRLLHRLALGSRAVAETAMDLDRNMFKVDREAAVTGQHVFVSGLARAGTTILMRQLHATGQFRSLTYRDMPFVLAPNLWAKLTGRAQKSGVAQERAHGDGIAVDFDSPEALEEVFWRHFCADSYIQDTHLIPMQADAETRGAFQSYVAAILLQSRVTRYLSKNNNNIMRLPSIADSFPRATILVPFRDPVAHAQSLLKQHQSFVDRHATDKFARSYMTWLAHHEFGADSDRRGGRSVLWSELAGGFHPFLRRLGGFLGLHRDLVRAGLAVAVSQQATPELGAGA